MYSRQARTQIVKNFMNTRRVNELHRVVDRLALRLLLLTRGNSKITNRCKQIRVKYTRILDTMYSINRTVRKISSAAGTPHLHWDVEHRRREQPEVGARQALRERYERHAWRAAGELDAHRVLRPHLHQHRIRVRDNDTPLAEDKLSCGKACPLRSHAHSNNRNSSQDLR